MKKLVLSIFLLLCTSSFAQQTTIIKNSHLQQHVASITKQEAFWIFTLRTRFWPDGTRIVVYHMDLNSVAHIVFCRDVLGTSAYQYKTSLETYKTSANSMYLRQVSSEQEMFEKVSRTIGAIGYVSENIVLVNDDNNIRRVNIVK